jgi:geranylgeranyl reductase family protein
LQELFLNIFLFLFFIFLKLYFQKRLTDYHHNSTVAGLKINLTGSNSLGYIELPMKNTTCDVLIVGAGPAGSTAAFLLASCGLKVHLLDRRNFPRPKLCGGLLTWKTIQTLERVFQIGPRALASIGIIRSATREYMVADRCGRRLCRRLGYPFHLVDRKAYDDFWLQHAISAGAEFHPGSAVATVDLTQGELTTDKGEKWKGRFVIGADGVNSRIRQALVGSGKAIVPPRPGTAMALECAVPHQAGSFPKSPAIYYGYVPWGYAWSFPFPEHQVLGIAALRQRAGRQIMSSFREFASSLHISDVRALPVQGHPLPYGNYLRTPGHGNILLAGDAAYLADPFLGEGVYYAHRSAELAAQAVIASRSQPESAIDRYRESFRRIIHPELKYARAGRQLIFSLPPGFYFPVLAALLRLIPTICEETIQGQRSFKWFQKSADRPAGGR